MVLPPLKILIKIIRFHWTTSYKLNGEQPDIFTVSFSRINIDHYWLSQQLIICDHCLHFVHFVCSTIHSAINSAGDSTKVGINAREKGLFIVYLQFCAKLMVLEAVMMKLSCIDSVKIAEDHRSLV